MRETRIGVDNYIFHTVYAIVEISKIILKDLWFPGSCKYKSWAMEAQDTVNQAIDVSFVRRRQCSGWLNEGLIPGSFTPIMNM